MIEGGLEGYQLYDIAALRHLYGSNVSDTSDTVFDFADIDEKLITVWDAGGHDVIDTRSSDYGNKIDLNAGAFSTVSELGLDNIAIAFGTEIEDAIGSDFDDTILGNDVDNRIDGGAGNDTMSGGAGADTYGFASGWGQDTIENYVIGEDRVDFSEAGLTLEDLLITMVDGDTVISVGENSLRLTGFEEELDQTFMLF